MHRTEANAAQCYPKQHLRQSDHGYADHFAHHQLEGAHAAHDDLNYTRGLFLHDPSHHLRPKREDGDENQKGKYQSDDYLYLQKPLSASLDVLRAEVNTRIADECIVIHRYAVHVQQNVVA